MSAAETIRTAEASGIRLGVEGADLILDADLEPPVDVVNAIRRHKAEIIELLAPPGDRWAVEDSFSINLRTGCWADFAVGDRDDSDMTGNHGKLRHDR